MVDVTLQAKPAHLTIATPARIVIDGRDAGAGPTAVDLAAGKHLVALLHDGREPWAEELVLGRGEERALAAGARDHREAAMDHAQPRSPAASPACSRSRPRRSR